VAEEPSVIVDMGPNIDSLIDDLCQSTPEQEKMGLQSILDAGEAALPVLVQRFPGPLWFDRQEPHRRLPRGRDISAIARTLVVFGERAVPYVVSLLHSRETETRFYATLLVAEFLHRDLLAPTVDRLFDPDAGIRALALDVFRMFRPLTKPYLEALDALRNEVSVPRKDASRRPIAVRVLGELRDEKSVTSFIELLRLPDRELSTAVRRSLVLVTRQDFGDSQRKWVTWFEKNHSRHRVEWLMDALLHNEEEIRSAAAEELKQLTQQYFGYHPGLPKREREIVQKKYRSWWETEGQKVHP
jgi:HEAT repeat protein